MLGEKPSAAEDEDEVVAGAGCGSEPESEDTDTEAVLVWITSGRGGDEAEVSETDTIGIGARFDTIDVDRGGATSGIIGSACPAGRATAAEGEARTCGNGDEVATAG